MADYKPPCLFDDSNVGFDVGLFDGIGVLTDDEILSIGETKQTEGTIDLSESFTITDGMYIAFCINEVIAIIDSMQEYFVNYRPPCLFDDDTAGFDFGGFDNGLLKDGMDFLIEDTKQTEGTIGLSESLAITDGMYVNLSVSETIAVIDSITIAVEKNLSEALGIVDSISRSAIFTLNETLNTVDSIVRSTTFFLSETVSAVDSAFIAVEKNLGETLGIADVIYLSGNKFLNESLLITDGSLIILLVSEVLNAIDSIYTTVEKAIAESLNAVDSIGTIGEKVLNETLGVADTISVSVSLCLSEAIEMIDSVKKKMLMIIRKITIRFRSGSYESDIELED